MILDNKERPMRWRHCWWILCWLSLLAGCSSYPLYKERTLVHPRAGTTVTCGHWIWWECQVLGYHNYVEVPTPLEAAEQRQKR